MKVSLTFGKGINFDMPAFELAPGLWSAGTVNFRSRGGMDESWDGANLHYSTGAVKPLWGMPYTTSVKYGVYCSATKLYAITGASTVTDITRKTDGIVITSLTAAGTTVTANTASAHGLTAAVSVVDVYGNIPSTYNIDGVTVASTPTATSFTFVVAVAPAVSPATVPGAYAVSPNSDFSALSGFQRYTGGAWNGLFIFNHPGAGLYYWNGDTSLDARKVPGFSGTATWNTAVSVRPWKGFLIALGKTENGTTYRQNVTVSDVVSDPATLPASWASSATNQADSRDLTETNGSAVDFMPMGDQGIVYFTDCRYAMQYVESAPYFVYTRLPGRVGLAFPNCVVSTPVGHVFLTADYDVMVHAGGEAKSIAAGRVKKFLTDNLVVSLAHLSFLCVYPNKSEVWVCFPTAPASGTLTVCTRALVWNYADDTWGYFDLTSNATDLSGVAFGANGQWPSADVEYTNKDTLFLLSYHSTDSAKTGLYKTFDEENSGYTGQFFGADLGGTLIRQGLDCGDRDRMKTLHRSRWVLDGAGSDTVSVSHGSSRFPDSAPTYTSSVFYTQGTHDYANARATQGKYVAIKATWTGNQISTVIRLRSVDLDIAPGGTR